MLIAQNKDDSAGLRIERCGCMLYGSGYDILQDILLHVDLIREGVV